MFAVVQWLYANVTGNLVASGITFVTAWFWKIRPHLRRAVNHRAEIEQQLADLHDKHDALHAELKDGTP